MKAVMYHYVREFDKEQPYFKALHIEDFIKQLDYLEQEFGIATYNDILKVKNGIPVDKVLLTFDDGVIDHYKFVFPELKKRGKTGIFYVPTLPYAENKMLDVHKTHLILGTVDAAVVLKTLEALITSNMLEHTEEFDNKTYVHQTNDECTLRVKRILNYFLSYNYRTEVIDKLFSELLGHQEEYCSSYYMNKDQIRELVDNNMIVGSHSISHPVFSRLNEKEQRKEIVESFLLLNQICGEQKIKTFCYPYGGAHSFNSLTVNILNEIENDFSFSVEPKDISPMDLRYNKQDLPRYDCNFFKYGQCR
jgi:peptidoglycan/xylan/chitin deacetylase (PgdA/CDA1 family)